MRDNVTVTYDPEDDKLRVYTVTRLPDADLEPLKAAGFRWAGAQQCWSAVWSPEREDAALALAGEGATVEDERSTLAERAAVRAERFRDYQGGATEERDRLWERDRRLAEAMNGQPVLIGHHSEQRHRRDLARMDAAMRGACKAQRRADYWAGRAHGAQSWAARKESPAVRARRIKTLEADARRWERHIGDAKAMRAALELPAREMYAVATLTHHRLASSLYDAQRIEDGEARRLAIEDIAARARVSLDAGMERNGRWLQHVQGRIAWERATLEQQGASALLAPKPRKVQPPLLNLRQVPAHRDRWGGEVPASVATECTAAEYAQVHRDYKGTRTIGVGANAYRVRTAMESSLPKRGSGLVVVFLTDKREDTAPGGEA